MSILAYTTYDDVRAALGVSVRELSDATLALQLYEGNLTLEFLQVGANLQATLDTALAASSPSAAQRQLVIVGRLLATYAVARTACSALPNFSPQHVTDGKAGFSRFANSPYQDVIEDITARLTTLRTQAQAALAAVLSPATPTVQVHVAIARSTGEDPVVGLGRYGPRYL